MKEPSLIYMHLVYIIMFIFLFTCISPLLSFIAHEVFVVAKNTTIEICDVGST